MIEDVELAREFERHRARLRAIAHRILGSQAEADDAVQETWLRLSRSDDEAIANLVDRDHDTSIEVTSMPHRTSCRM